MLEHSNFSGKRDRKHRSSRAPAEVIDEGAGEIGRVSGLQGSRVLDLSRSAMGALAARHLAEIGSYVLRSAEPAAAGDEVRLRLRHRGKRVVATTEARLLERVASQVDLIVVDSEEMAEATREIPVPRLQLRFDAARGRPARHRSRTGLRARSAIGAHVRDGRSPRSAYDSSGPHRDSPRGPLCGDRRGGGAGRRQRRAVGSDARGFRSRGRRFVPRVRATYLSSRWQLDLPLAQHERNRLASHGL